MARGGRSVTSRIRRVVSVTGAARPRRRPATQMISPAASSSGTRARRQRGTLGRRTPRQEAVARPARPHDDGGGETVGVEGHAIGGALRHPPGVTNEAPGLEPRGDLGQGERPRQGPGARGEARDGDGPHANPAPAALADEAAEARGARAKGVERAAQRPLAVRAARSAPAQRGGRGAQHFRAEITRQRAQRARGQDESLGLPRSEPGQHVGGLALERGDEGARPGGRLRQPRRHARIEARGEKGQHVRPDPVPHEAELAIGGILHPDDAACGQMRPRGSPRRLQQWTDIRPAHGGDAAEPPRTGPLEEPHHHRLGLIVGGVPGGNPVGADGGRGASEGRVARAAGGCLRSFPTLAGTACDLDALDAKRHIPTPTEVGHEGGVRPGLGAKSVVDVDGPQGEAQLGSERPQHVEERHRIRATRDRRQDDIAATEHPVAASGGADAVDDASGGGHIPTGARPRPRRPRSTPSSRWAPSP